MAQTSVDIPQLKFNKMSTAKYNELKKAGQLVENEFYITPDGGTIPEVNTDTNQQVLSNDGTNLIWRNEQVGYKQITNCITEIPQDIKLELNDGTLTLKAGSNVYVPNGFEEDGTTPKFNIRTLTEDMVRTKAESLYTIPNAMLTIHGAIDFIDFFPTNEYYSGPTAPSTGQIWYDTRNNLIKINIDGIWTSRQHCLPIGLVNTSDTDGFTSIDQIFNGFGYIGSTIFALPGVKGLIPNGRNEDGSLKNVEFTTQSVLTQTLSATAEFTLYLDGSTFGRSTSTSYYPEQNKVIDTDGYHNNTCIVGDLTQSGATITQLKVKQPFHAVDYNDKSTISGWSMPSDRYIDLTLGASGASYIAPANGWFWLSKKSSAANQYMNIGNNISGYVQNYSSGASDVMNLMRPARKGETVFIYYNVAGSTNYFKFVYAEGEN